MSQADDNELVLHVVWSPFDDAAHIVSSRTIAAAKAADEAPVLVDFGDLRESGDIDELGERLADLGVTVEEYATAIEQSAGRSPVGGDLTARLAAISDVSFAGSTDPENGREFPAASDDFRSDWEIEETPGRHVEGA